MHWGTDHHNCSQPARAVCHPLDRSPRWRQPVMYRVATRRQGERRFITSSRSLKMADPEKPRRIPRDRGHPSADGRGPFPPASPTGVAAARHAPSRPSPEGLGLGARSSIATMMTGEQPGMGHKPRHGTAYVNSWTRLWNDSREIRAAAVDAQRMPRLASRPGTVPTPVEGRADGSRVDGGKPIPAQPRREAGAVAARTPSAPERDAPRPEVGPSR